MDRSATIKIRRRAAYMGIMRAFKIYVDDKKIGNIDNGKEVDFQIEPGRRRIEVLGSLWSKSQVLEIEVPAGQTLTFECGVLTQFWYPFMVVCIMLSIFARPIMHMMSGRSVVALAIALGASVLAIVLTALTFKRGALYYLKQTGPGRG